MTAPSFPAPTPPGAHLDDLSFLKGKLFFSSIWIRGHGEGVIVKQRHKDPGRELFGTWVSLRLFIEVWRKAVPLAVLVWEQGGTKAEG